MHESELDSELRKDILLGFHTQFAENQRSREGTFLQFLALLGAALAGYAVLFRITPDASYSTSAVLFFQMAIATVLFAGARLVVVISNNFRRDQFVNVRIRRASQLIGSREIFPESYDPRIGLRRWGLFSWMPDFFQAMFWLFVLFQAAALIAFAHLLNLRLGPPIDLGVTAVVIISVFLASWSTFIVPWIYRGKLLPVMDLDPVEFGISAAVGRRLGQLQSAQWNGWWKGAKSGFMCGWRDESKAIQQQENHRRWSLTISAAPEGKAEDFEQQMEHFRFQVSEAAHANGLCINGHDFDVRDSEAVT